jgi:uncharacterized protein YuzE
MMKTTYFDEEDTLVIHLSDKPITKEVSQDRNTHISYAADRTIVEVVILKAKAHGLIPTEIIRSA